MVGTCLTVNSVLYFLGASFILLPSLQCGIFYFLIFYFVLQLLCNMYCFRFHVI